MGNGITVELIGGKKIDKALKKRFNEVAERLDDIAFAGGEPIFEEAEENAPDRTGKLKKEMMIAKIEKESSDTTSVVGVGPSRKAFYASMVELGTSAHTVRRKDAKGLWVGANAFRASMKHRGAKKQPFLRPAFDKNQKKALKAMKELVQEALGL